MPSGAKKRKAAKKKKEKETHNGKSSTDDNPQGNNEVTSQDEKGSDGGEVGSTAFQKHHNQQDPFKKSNEELGERGPSSVPPVVSEDKSGKGAPSGVEAAQKVGLKNDDGVRIERELKQDSASKNVIIERAKSGKGSHNGDDRSSSSSSSDDESRVVERRQKEDSYASVSEEKPHNDLVRSIDSSPPEVIQTTEEKLLPTGTPVTLTDPVSKNIENRTSPLLNETAKASSSTVESVSRENESKVLPSLGTSRAQVSNDAESSKNPEIPEYSEKQPLVTPAPPVPRKTSWFSCCGILEAITGSSR
ncbi:hypothetical protein L3X38_022011 [Prunus dulcis]|uniref:Uncharacterized protein n=1 Tax=Prunus dulcis TaxID=3755 RepID=A0AAD4Z3X0_PRUDU|nr:hypothetical protein L3X38_022011 [Prunus dulcis]